MKKLKNTWFQGMVGVVLLLSSHAPPAFSLPPRIVPNVNSRIPGVIQDKATELGQLQGVPNAVEAPPLFRESSTSVYALNPCPPTLEEPEGSQGKHPLHDGCEFGEDRPPVRNLAGERARDGREQAGEIDPNYYGELQPKPRPNLQLTPSE